MTADTLLEIIGEARETYVLSALDSRNRKKRAHNQYSFGRIVLIAAMVALLLFLVGCGAYIIVRNLYWTEELQEDLLSYNEISNVGNVSKNWIIDESAVELSAQPPHDGNLEITCTEWSQKADGMLTVGNEYWIEKWNGTTYEEIPTLDRTPWIVPEQEIVCGTKSNWSVNYREKYGELGAGEYRIGMIFSKVSSDGEIAQLGCYAKFNIQVAAYIPDLESFVGALNDILDAEAYHIIYAKYNLPNFSPYSETKTDLWKSGNNYAKSMVGRDKNSNEWEIHGNGYMLQNGVGYGIEWPNELVSSNPTSWSKQGYVDESSFYWSVLFDSAYQNAIEVHSSDNQLNIIAPTGIHLDRFYEMRIFYTESGTITRMECAGIPDRTYNEEDRELWTTVDILPTTPEEAAALLQSIDVSKPESFSYQGDLLRLEQQECDRITEHFRNQAEQHEMTVASAERLARAEVPTEVDTVKVFFDQAESVWKVEFTYSLDDNLYYAVYMNDRGVTQMIATARLE